MERKTKRVDPLICGYLVLSGVLAFALGYSWLALLHGVLVLSVGWLRGVWREVYSVALVPLFYGELDVLSELAGGRSYDDLVLSWEGQLFGEPTPAMWFSELFPWLGFSELLHLCYLAYYPLIPWVAYRVYRGAGLQRFRQFLWTLQGAVLGGFLIQSVFPVEGPRLLFPPLEESLRGPCWTLCHYLCGEGAAAAAAFPSGHVSFALAGLICTGLWERRTFSQVWPWMVGLILATVYGRFHYVVDDLAALAMVILSLGLSYLMTESVPKARPGGPDIQGANLRPYVDERTRS